MTRSTMAEHGVKGSGCQPRLQVSQSCKLTRSCKWSLRMLCPVGFWWYSGPSETHEHLFKHCRRWKDQRIIVWREISKPEQGDQLEADGPEHLDGAAV
jgi:hypothetical protein